MTAISLTLVPHVIAIKRTSTLLSVVWGHFLFRESGFRKRLAGSAVMLAGVLLILWP
jgi:drug/metabolite transporter (DMT)-like permease